MTRSPIVPLLLLRPTQVTVGMRQVRHKRAAIRALAKRPAELLDFLMVHPIRIVRGPSERAYVIDHHHLALALLKESFETVPMQVEADFSALNIRAFWQKMSREKFVHPYDAHGVKLPLSHIPDHLRKLEDDPYRSLAGFVRAEGGFNKVQTPFAEFAWADYFRAHIGRKKVRHHFKKALETALALAREPEARHLPGALKP